MMASSISIKCYWFGDANDDAKVAMAGWNSMPMVTITEVAADAGSFCTCTGGARNPLQYGFVNFVKYNSAEDYATNLAFWASDEVVALQKAHATTVVSLRLSETESIYVGVHNAAEDWLAFNAASGSMPYLAEGKMMAVVAKIDCYAYGLETEGVKAAMAMWNSAPMIDVMMCPDIGGYSMDGVCGFYQTCEFNDAAGLDAWIAASAFISGMAAEVGAYVMFQSKTSETAFDCVAILPNNDALNKLNAAFGGSAAVMACMPLMKKVTMVPLGCYTAESMQNMKAWDSPEAPYEMVIHSHVPVHTAIPTAPGTFGMVAVQEYMDEAGAQEV
jgi:hypothetical protein